MEAGTSSAIDEHPAWLKEAMDAPVTALLGPMGPLLRQIYGRPMNVNSEIQQLVKEDSIEGLVTTLKDLAEAEHTSFMAKWWMKEVRELCYDTEDHFDEVMMNSRAGIAARILVGICSKLKQQQPLIASDFSEIMARVKDASKRRDTFQLASKPTGAGADFEKAGAIVPFCARMDTGGRTWCRPMDDLVELMAFDDESQKQLKVVSILGIAGVGKTTAAKKLYDQFGRNFDCRAFLRVSRNPDIRRLLTSILSQIKAPEIPGFPDVQFLTASIREHLQEKRYVFTIFLLCATSSRWIENLLYFRSNDNDM